MYLFCFQKCFYQNLSNKLLLGSPWHAIWNHKSESVIEHQEEKNVLIFTNSYFVVVKRHHMAS